MNNHLKIGLEKEFFLLSKEGTPCVIPNTFPMDACGLLLEARGMPFFDPVDAVYSLKADCFRLTQLVKSKDFTLTDIPLMKIDKKTRLEASRKYQKGLTQYQNIYGYEFHKNRTLEQTAGVHISFTNPKTINIENNRTTTVNEMFDWVQLFKQLDVAFAEEIKGSMRRPGFYEIKPDGRIEYRSLPSNVNLVKVIDVLNRLLKITPSYFPQDGCDSYA